ncbi:TPA: hypothetical protein U1C36_001507 [Streptococcus suis]|uniref:hypothetical protein n=1 Tax=Streptococcus suis TaxID=1307 RepID=UPI001ABDA264|nr:hypothetical protein [Streptococcus suis]MBO4110114.1 hypothetical protein [Streptococcus suis]HEM3642364.1 hypothetical protein [Streptococcus suis]
MSEQIQISLSSQEQIILHALRITELATEITQTIQQVVETIPSFSSQGSFHTIYTTGKNDGFYRYVLKAQELKTLSEVLYRHVETTHQQMVDMDRALAVHITNQFLNSPSTSSDDKRFIREHPEEAVRYIHSEMKKSTPSSGGGS